MVQVKLGDQTTLPKCAALCCACAAALMALKKKKMYETQLEQCENNILRVNEQQMMLENQRTTVETVTALRDAAHASKSTMSEMKITDVDQVRPWVVTSIWAAAALRWLQSLACMSLWAHPWRGVSFCRMMVSPHCGRTSLWAVWRLHAQAALQRPAGVPSNACL